MRATHRAREGMGHYGANLMDNGIFEFSAVPPGSYRLGAGDITDKMHMTGRLLVEAGSTNIDDVVLTVGPPPELSGRIVLEGKSELSVTTLSVFL